MNVIGIGNIENDLIKYSDCRSPLSTWVSIAEVSDWEKPSDVKIRYPSSSILPNNNIIFNIKGNNYRLWVAVNYKNKTIIIKKFGTHDEYLKWIIK